jgi:hypothetical protein
VNVSKGREKPTTLPKIRKERKKKEKTKHCLTAPSFIADFGVRR